MRTAKTLIRLGGSESSLGADMFKSESSLGADMFKDVSF